jgi:hypothetical protein
LSGSRLRKLGFTVLATGTLTVLVSTPAWAPPSPYTPGPATSVTVTPGDGQGTVTWAPAYTTFRGYFPDAWVTSTAHGNVTCTAPGQDATTCTLTGLTNGKRYTVVVYPLYHVKPGSPERKGIRSARVRFVPAA